MELNKTTNYAQFKKLPGNRPIDWSHVNKLIHLISQKNMLSTNAIKVNKQMEVVDGQHRLEAAKKQSWEIYYTIEENGDLHDAQLLNAGAKNWSMKDFLESHIELENGNYRYLKSFMQKYDLPLGISLVLLADGKYTSQQRRDLFKQGEFKAVNYANADIMAQRLLDMKPYVEEQVRRDREFLEALRDVYGHVSHKDLLAKLMQVKPMIVSSRLKKDYIRQLEDVYNFRRQNKVRFF